MRRILSAILVCAMMMAFLPIGAYAAEGEAFTINFGTYDKSTAYTEDNARYYLKSTTKGENWAVDTANTTSSLYAGGTTKYACRLQSQITIAKRDRTDGGTGPATLAFKFTAPKSGTYDVDIKYYAYNAAGYGDVLFIDGSTKTYLGSICAYKEANFLDETADLLSVTLEGGKEYSVGFKSTGKSETTNGNMYVYTVTFTPSESPMNFGGIEASVESSVINEGETAAITIVESAPKSVLYRLSSVKENISYKSSDEKIATVSDEGVITAVSKGNATITATLLDGGKEYIDTVDITVPDNAPGEAVSETVKVYIDATTGGSVTADKVTASVVADAEAGTKITAEATANEGYKFAYWKDSAGNVVSESATYSFNAYTNTSIIAVFDNVSEENTAIGVEFFDGNRDYLGFIETVKGATFDSIANAPPANLTGYEFKGWSIEDNAIINGVLRAVALYKEEGNPVSGVEVNGSAKTDTKYDDAITETVEGAKAWYRDEKLVGYGDTYTYYVWSATSITSSDVEVTEKLPIAVLNASGDAYMLEYDSAGYEIVDAGILFGDDTHNTVNACYYKAKVKNIKPHGQFTAKKSVDTEFPQTSVRGYVMFKDTDGAIRVIYSK
ncbi:MAG: Ig-like domain-containing protein [Oscillospiraceae bacterium]|nr:Ig-like domain-containing protein [Oscillospiraceae bacterium]